MAFAPQGARPDVERALMPKGPQGQRRPADAVGCAVHVAKIATGEIKESGYAHPNKVRGGRLGAKARAEGMTAKERSEIAKLAAKTRWKR